MVKRGWEEIKVKTVEIELSFAAEQWFSSGEDFASRVPFANVCRSFFLRGGATGIWG